MPVWNFGCGMTNFNGAKLVTGFNLPLHLSTLICIAVDEASRYRYHYHGNYMSSLSWKCGLLLTGALFCFLGYFIAGIGLVKSSHKVLFGSLAIIGFGALLFTTGLCGTVSFFHFIIIPFIIYYLTLQVWSWCLIFGTALETMNSPTYPKDGPILLQ